MCYNLLVKKRIPVILIICLCVCALAFAACANMSRVPKLKTPIVSGNGGFYAVWEKVDGAGMYFVRVKDTSSGSTLAEETVTETSFSLTEFAFEDKERAVQVYVAAIPSSEEYAKSEEGSCKITIPHVDDKEMLQYALSFAPSAADLAANIEAPNYTYYPATDMDLTISFAKNVASIKPLGNYDLSEKFASAHSINGSSVVISKSYLQQFDIGAAIQFEATLSDGAKVTHSVFVVEKVVKLVDPYDTQPNGNLIYRGEGYIAYSEHDGRNVEFTFFDQVKVNSVCVDGEKVSFVRSKEPNKQMVNASVLKGLSEGVHYISIYTDKGAVTVPVVYTPEYSCAPDGLYVDLDGYPDIYIRWEANLEPAYYTVTINGETYSSNDYPELFTVNSFNATGKLNAFDSLKDSISVTAYLPEAFGGKSYTSSVTCGDFSSYLPYLQNTFDYLGSEENFYFTSDEEWNTFVAYTALYYEELESTGTYYTENSEFKYTYPYKRVSFAMGYGNWSAHDIANKKYEDGTEQFREVVAYKVTCTKVSDNIFSLTLLQTSYKEPSKNASDLAWQYRLENREPLKTTQAYAHYSSTGNSGTFPIDSVENTANVSTSMQLYFALERGLRPLPEAGSSAERIWNKARAVMAEITDTNMSDYEIVHAIYDYLTTEVVYDNAVAKYNGDRTSDQDLYNDVYNYNCFYPEGVFDDGVAVCNGLSQAFVIMCAIEGIESVKIGGTVPNGAHAWNKVNIDGMWYIVDTTWGMADYQSGFTTYSIGQHDWLLVSEAAASSTHTQDIGVYGSNFYGGGVNYDPYANMFYLDESGNMHDHKAASYNELNDILAHYAGKYELPGTYLVCVSVTFSYFSESLWNNSAVKIPTGMTVYSINGSLDRQAEIIMVRR